MLVLYCCKFREFLTISAKKGTFVLLNCIALIKIAITGPESTGKSALAQKLAFHFNTLWVPEYAREYLETLNRHYEYDDILQIAQGQLKLEDETALRCADYLICDTELLVTKVWCDFHYQKCHQWIKDQLSVTRYNLLLLCDIDLPWEFDPQRENPDDRNTLFDMYYRELSSGKFPFEVIRGSGEKRFQNALKAIEKHLVKINV